MATWIQSSLTYMGMSSTVLVLAGTQIITKMAISSGTSVLTLSLYPNAFAALILFPSVLLFYRSKLPLPSFSVIWRIFVLAFFGCLGEISVNAGVGYSSPTLSSALLNLIPTFTFILAVIFRLEEVNLRRLSTIAKISGTIISISGAFIISLYNGPRLLNTPDPRLLHSPAVENWALGGFLLSVGAFGFAASIVLQAPVLKMYPVPIVVVAFQCLFSTIHFSVVILIADTDFKAWRIETAMGFVAIAFNTIFAAAYRQYVDAWCTSKRGPFFVSLFKPFTVVVVVFIGVIFMNQVLYLGSLVGALTLMVGFYGVIWGKSEEAKKKYEETDESSNYVEAPLLRQQV